MAGFFDELLNDRPRANLKEKLMARLIPLVGYDMATDSISRRAAANSPQMFSDPAALSDMGMRVQERMLARSGGNTSKVGFMANHMMSQEAEDPLKANNMGNVAAAAATRLTAADPTAGAKLGQLAHKQFQTPWKPSEGGVNAENFQFPDGKVVTLTDPKAKQAALSQGAVQVGISQPDREQEIVPGASLGMAGAAAEDYYAVERNAAGKITSAKKLDNAPKISVSATSAGSDIGGLITDSDISKEIVGAGYKLNSFKDSERVFDELTGILKTNPYGVTGWGGAITAFSGKVANLTGFLQQAGSRINADGETEASVLGRFSGKINEVIKTNMPTVPQAQAQSLIISLAYAIARMNNMGTAGGGRGITDADMEYAMRQLAASSTPEAMIKVLESERKRARARLADDLRNTDTIIKSKDETKGLPKQWLDDVSRAMPRGTDPEIDALVQGLLNGTL